MAKKVTVIPAMIRQTAAEEIAPKKRRVAAYARVSTDSAQQATSYEAQVDYYTTLIKGRSDWEFAGMYTDEGISGTNTKYREGFKKMVDDALEGGIDLIITKSVSRFARNTVDSLTTVRNLKEKGVEIYFEKENIWTLDSKGELLITIMSSLAQEESRSISENVKWGRRKQFADGKASVSYSTFLGYDEGFVINKEQANTVRLIYKLFLSGESYNSIARELERRGLKAPAGGDKWHADGIKSILTNEKYKGDALLQKTYTADFLTKRTAVNKGEIPQYYVEGHHEAIIDSDTFQLVQAEIKRNDGRANHTGIFSSKIICSECGSFYGRKIWHSTDKYKRVVWQCNNRYKKEARCTKNNHVLEDYIKESFMKAVQKALIKKEALIENAKTLMSIVEDTTDIERELRTGLAELKEINERLEKCIRLSAGTGQGREKYEEESKRLSDEFDAKAKACDKKKEMIEEAKDSVVKIKEYIKFLSTEKTIDKEFDTLLWIGMLDYVNVKPGRKLEFVLKDGMVIT